MEMLIMNFKNDISYKHTYWVVVLSLVAPITIEILRCIYMLHSGVLICILLVLVLNNKC